MNDSEENPNGMGEIQNDSEEDSKSHAGIGDEVDVFRKQIDSLAETLPLTMVAIRVGHDIEKRRNATNSLPITARWNMMTMRRRQLSSLLITRYATADL